MTKRSRRKSAGTKSTMHQAPLLRMQARCTTCGRFKVLSEPCWACNPRWPDPCICDVYVPLGTPALGRHRHFDHELIGHEAQMAYESIDETILMATDFWPASDDDFLEHKHEEIVGVAATRADIDDLVLEKAADFMPRRDSREELYPEPVRYKKRIHWREQPEYKAFLARYPELKRRARQGIDSIFAYFDLTPSEADVWSLDAAGYTHDWIAMMLRYKPGGVAALLDSVESKIHAKLARLRHAQTGSWTA